jgi:demethoxyubiquinone hydroxylase (CLK1/Coq7/Cat5 family)
LKETAMLKYRFHLFALTALALPLAAAMAQPPEVDDHLWEHHREHCEHLEHEEHEIHERLQVVQDPEERGHLEHRLHEIAEDRDLQCRR